MRFKDQTVLITGAGYGIGKVAALSFGREGAGVVLAARSEEKIEAVAEELRAMGVKALALKTDVSSPEQVARLFERTRAEFGMVDVLVNNAGIAGPTALAREVSTAEWEETIAINLNGAFYCAREASAMMIEAKRGSIVNISSVGAIIGYALRTPYAASKAGMIGFNHALAAELGPYGIRVNVVLPGPTEGERIGRVIAARAETEGKSLEEAKKFFTDPIALKRMPSEQEVADMILFLASDQASAVTAQAIHVDGGFWMK